MDDIIGGWVKDAEKSGEVKKLPGYGKPLALEDERAVPPKYRMAFRILKNSGYTPSEVELIKKVGSLKAAIDASSDPAEQRHLRKELAELQQRLDVALEKFRSDP
ncbi:MAG: DnaJ family domain-containing protein [Pseudomonadota bacterium]